MRVVGGQYNPHRSDITLCCSICCLYSPDSLRRGLLYFAVHVFAAGHLGGTSMVWNEVP